MALQALTLVTMELIAQIALGVIIGGLTIALLVMGFLCGMAARGVSG
jgi:hypothetical protein